MFAVTWAQKFARVNRDIMMSSVLKAAHSCSGIPQFEVDPFSKAVNCHHNYVNLEMHFGKEVFLTRKGAVSNKDTKIWCFIIKKSFFCWFRCMFTKKFCKQKQANKKTKPKGGQKSKKNLCQEFSACIHSVFWDTLVFLFLCYGSC